MEDWQQRVVDEKAALDEKLERLSAFWAGEQFDKVDAGEQQRLSRQRQLMTEYSDVLRERIEAWG